MSRFARAAFCVMVLALYEATLSAVARGQGTVPTITATEPQAIAPGQTLDIKFRGGGLARPTQLWLNFPAEVRWPADLPGNGTNPALVTCRIKVASDLAPGIYGLRVATAEGISGLRLFAVDDLPTIAQNRPNQSPSQAQTVAPPVAVDGAIENLGRDYYRFKVAAGQRLSFEVLARRLGSPLDPMIRLLDSKGREVAYNDDAAGIGADSQLSFAFAQAGEYVLEVRDIRYQGGDKFHYRLRIGDFPLVSAAYPLGIQRGSSARVEFAGPDAPLAQPIPVNVGADSNVNWVNVAAKASGGKSSGLAVVSVGADVEILEIETDQDPGQAQRVELGANLNGRFERPGDSDRFVFSAKANQRFVFTGVTRTQGSPSDLFVRLLKGDGSEAAAADDSGPNDAAIDYTFPDDADYTLVVEDLHGRGGPQFVYRIAVEPFQEKFSLSASTDTINVPAGGLAMVTVTANRGKFKGPITLGLEDPPEGVQAMPTVIGPGANMAVLTIACTPQVPPGKIHFLRIVGSAQEGETRYRATASLVDALKGTLGGLPNPPQALLQSVALGVNPPPLFSLTSSAPEVVLGKDLSATVRIIAERTEGFDSEIALAVQPAGLFFALTPPGLPAGVTAEFKPIGAALNEAEVVFKANAQAQLGSFSVVLAGTGKSGEVTAIQPIPALTMTLRPPFSLKPEPVSATLKRGQTLPLKVAVERNPAYRGPIALTFQNLPKGVTAAEATIAEGQNEIEIVLSAADDVAVGKIENISIKGQGTAGKARLPADSPPFAVTVE
ncbi:MAG: PPC domain-containing protein [Planctomycetaceae bacterium]